MKKSLILLVLMSMTWSVFGSAKAEEAMKFDPVADEVRSILEDESDTVLSDLTFGEVEQLMRRISVPAQEAAYVNASQTASFMMPGKGQFMNDDALSGILFMSADLAVTVGTFIGGYFLLPTELRFDQLDYLNTPYIEIKNTWQNAFEQSTLTDWLAHAGVMTGGMVLHGVIAKFSAAHAGRLARERIDEGIIQFEPATTFSGYDGFGFGGRMKF